MPIHEIRVRPTQRDTKGRGVLSEIKRTIGETGIENVKTNKVYRLEGISEEEARKLAEKLLCEPIDQEFTLNKPRITDTTQVVEIAYKPGVMNPEAASIMKAAKDLGINPVAVDSSTEYAFYGGIRPSGIVFPVPDENITKVVDRLLMNKTVERVVDHKPETLIIKGEPGKLKTVPVRDASEEDLMALSKDKLFLNSEEMHVIQNYFTTIGRDPTDCELEIIAARWSEHCGHKTFKARIITKEGEKAPLFSRIKSTAEKYFGHDVISAFDDNSGAMRFYEGMAINGKGETHNKPSAIEPYGGAMTGLGGVIRDPADSGKGAKVINSTDIFCFGPPDLDPIMLPEGTLHPDYTERRVVDGVRDYGNRMGIPTNNGSVHYHKDFRTNPTVIVTGYGILPENMAQKGRPEVGDLVVVVGGRTGRDGIHGATFSSGESTNRTINVNSSAVQIGNAIEEKRMFDAGIEVRDRNLVRAKTDCGAAGFSSAIGELAEDVGAIVDISKAPLKYPSMDDWEIWLSESQEREVFAVDPKNIEEFMNIYKKYNVEVTVLGHFDGSNRLKVMNGDRISADLDYDFLKHGLPQRIMKANWEKPQFEEKEPEWPKDWKETLKKIMSHGNVCSKEPIVRQYDHTVQGTNALTPFSGKNYDGPNDAAVITPMLGKSYGMVVSHGLNPILNRIDPYWGSIWATAEAMSNYVAVGGNPDESAWIENYIWPFPDEQEMGSLDKAVDAVVDCMDALKRPVISGKDSLSSTYRGKDGEVIKIPPVLCMSVFGKIPDVKKTVTSDIKRKKHFISSKSSLFLVGKLDEGMAGSTYYDINGIVGNEVPKVDLNQLPKTLRAVHDAIGTGKVLACHDVSEGGVIGAVSEMTFGGDCGAKLNLDEKFADHPDRLLFNETAGTFIVEVENDKIAKKLFKGVPITKIGETSKDKSINVRVGRKTLFSVQTDELKQAWQGPIKKIFN
jgi:phosphoribosylformylglycinamidine synthase subunit PurSL